MTRRSTPCQDCRKHRRKCVRSADGVSCDRCIRLERDCILPDQNSDCTENSDECQSKDGSEGDYEAAVDGDKELQAMCEELAMLQRQMEQLDKALLGGKNPSKALQQRPFVWSQHQAQLLHSVFPSEWQMTIKNGRLRLETGIRNISELLNYGQRIRYLSPLPGAQNGTSLMYFESKATSIISTAMKLMRNHPSFSIRSSSAASIFPSLTYSISADDTRQSAWPLQVDPILAMTQLVDQYFTCYNISLPLLHEASFKARFRHLSDPNTCPITLAVCAFISVNKCKHSKYDTRQKRAMAEYFYSRCSTILFDIFDDPDRRLETVITINLLQKFYYVTLRFSESHKMATMAHLICQDLEPHYANNQAIPLVERVLFKRHSITSKCYIGLLDYLVGNNMDNMLPNDLYLETIPDELSETKGLVELFNLMLKAGQHPCTLVILKQARRIIAGEVGELSLETLLGYEEVMKEWWRQLPEEIKLCKDPYDYASAKIAIEQVTEQRQFVAFVYILTMMASVHSCLISPRYSADTNMDISSMIRERAFQMSHQCSVLLILCAKRLTTSHLFCHCIITSEFLFRTADSLMSLTTVKGSEDVRRTLTECLQEIDETYLEDHRVPKSQSPLAMLDMNANALPIETLYNDYPLPAYALMYDVLRHSAHKHCFGKEPQAATFPF